MIRNGDLLTIGLRGGNLWRLPTEAYAGLGASATVAGGIGGVSAAGGPIAMFQCVHAFGCKSVSVDAKVLRPVLLSAWKHETRVGGEFALGLYLFKVTAAVYRKIGGDSNTSISVGAGMQVLF